MIDDESAGQVESDLSTREGLDLYDRNRLAPAFFGVLFFAALAALLYTLSDFAHDIVLALVLVAMFRPLYHRLCRALGGHRWLASAATTAIALLVVAVPLTLLALTLVDQAQVAYARISVSLESADGPVPWMMQQLEIPLARIGFEVTPEQLQDFVDRVGLAIRDSAVIASGSLLSNVVALLIHGGVVLVIVFYLLVDADKLRRFVFDLSPLPEDEEELLVRRFRQVAKGTLIGNGIGSVSQGAICGLAMWVVGLPSPLFAAAVMSVLAFLPLVGVSIVVIPLSAYLFFTDSATVALTFLLFCLGQAAIMENVVKTKLIGAGAAMHDLLAFLSILGGLAVFGVLGILYGPLLATAFLTLTELYFTSYRRILALNFIGRKA